MPGEGPTAITIGVFDGVHRGHQALIARTVAVARASGLAAVAVTFDPHPDQVVRPGPAPALLTTLSRRLELLAKLGLDATLVVDFTPQFATLSPEQFVDEVLVGRLHAAAVVVGENFRFGHRGSGDAASLGALGARAGFSVETFRLCAPLSAPAWSSTSIRECLARGDVAAAAAALGRPHALTGVVVRGDGRGRALGFPTANLAVEAGLAIPADGVYAGWAVTGGRRWPAAISVGTNPTFGGGQRRVEAYLIDADLDLYGASLEVEFEVGLRPTIAFSTPALLVEAMSADVAAAREALRGANLGSPGSTPEASLRPAQPRPVEPDPAPPHPAPPD